MATRSAVKRVTAQPAWVAVAEAVARRMERAGGGRVPPRYFSDKASGRVLSEEERAAENVYIQKMEREKLEKLRRKQEKEMAERAAAAAAAAKGDKKKGKGAHPS